MCSRGTGTFDISTDDVYRVAGLLAAGGGAAGGRVPALRAVGERPQARRRQSRSRPPTISSRAGLEHDRHRRRRLRRRWVLSDRRPGSTATATTGRGRLRDVPVEHGRADAARRSRSPRRCKPGYVNDPSATTCTYRTPDHPTDRPLPGFTATAGGFSSTVPDQSIVTCTMVNRVPAHRGRRSRSRRTASDADAPPGPFVPVGVGGHLDVPRHATRATCRCPASPSPTTSPVSA